jgi:hypothetical protein
MVIIKMVAEDDGVVVVFGNSEEELALVVDAAIG